MENASHCVAFGTFLQHAVAKYANVILLFSLSTPLTFSTSCSLHFSHFHSILVQHFFCGTTKLNFVSLRAC